MNASSRYREVKSFILNIYCNCSKHCISKHCMGLYQDAYRLHTQILHLIEIQICIGEAQAAIE